MKKFSFLALAAAGMLFAACSSDREGAAVDPSTTTSYDQAFVGISIELPNTTTPTRANDDLNNGKEDEFEVKDATLLLFKGATEADATYLGAWSLENNFQNDEDGEDAIPSTKVTQTSVSVAQIDRLALLASESLYAYVIVNKNGVTFPTVGDTFESWRIKTFAAAKIGSEYDATNKTDKVSANGLMMTNAPISATAGGSSASTGAVTTAIVLNKDNIKSTKDAALAAPAGCVYVERSAAKLTVTLSATVDNQLKDPSDNTMAAEIDAFQIINTEPTYYNTRNSDDTKWLGYFSDFAVNDNTKYRFVSLQQFSPTIPTGGTHTTGFRTYFAKDPQYDVTATLDNPVATDGGNWIAATGRAFMPENTFDVANMTRENTTQATIRMKFNGGASFYSITNEATLYSAANINNAIAAHVQLLAAISNWMQTAKDDVIAQLKAVDNDKTYTATVSISAAVPGTEVAGDQDYTLSYAISATANGSDITAPDVSTATATAWDAAVTSAKNDYKVTLYKDGLAYYNVRIQHFGEAETPWDAKTDAGVIKVQPGETVAQIYGYTADATAQEKANNRFLGRYGVVRDNWYQLSIDAIRKLGSATPTPVNGDTTPDDEIDEEFYISCHVHILPWVLRTQSVNF